MDELKIINEYRNGSSSRELADKYDTYQNKIIRILRKYEEPIRSKSEAQLLALKQGRSEHPTAGKEMSSDTKIRQSESQAKRWKKMPEAQREGLRVMAKENWENRSDESKKAMLSKAGQALQKASKEGSKAEKFICKMLHQHGYLVVPHKTGLIPGNYELDIFLPEHNIVIELDGPQHFVPVFGEKLLNKNLRYDTIKNGLLLREGITLIRVKYIIKHLSQKIQRDLWDKINGVLQDIKSGHLTEKLIEVTISQE